MFEVALCWAVLSAISTQLVVSHEASSKPSIVLILTDGQDVALGGLEPMAKLKKLVKQEGAYFTNAFVHTPTCCPSRTSYLTGKYIHNGGAFNNTVEGNCNSLKWQTGNEQWPFARYAKKAGYRTAYIGNYLSMYGYDDVGGSEHVPPYWDYWLGQVGDSRYYNYYASVNGAKEYFGDTYDRDYFPDVVKNHSVKTLQDFITQSIGVPFLLVAAPSAARVPFTPAPQYSHVYDGKTAPRTPNWNHHSDDKHWLVRTTSVMDEAHINTSDTAFEQRLEALLSVDDLVGDIVATLDKGNVLDNTYIIFASDHGFQLGQFGIPSDARQPYEHDIRIPLMIRGPNIPSKTKIDRIALNIDIAPTIVAMTGLDAPVEMDGRSLTPLLFPTPQAVNSSSHGDSNGLEWRDDFLIDYHGESRPQCGLLPCPAPPSSDFHPLDAGNNTYTCVRTLSSSENTLYCEFPVTGYVEFYDMTEDPWQLNNTASTVDQQYIASQKARLKQLRKCSGESCRQ